MRNYTIKWGKWLLLRWLVASWLLHGVHMFDRTERNYYIACELFLLCCIYVILYQANIGTWMMYLVFFFVLHTITWLVDSHWLVGYREVNKNFRGKGICSVIEFSQLAKSKLMRYESVNAICIYGSLCRKMYHDRSDMDLRVVQTTRDFRVFLIIQGLRFIGIWKYRIPLDLKLVDSVDYLRNEMRMDEKPIMVFKRDKTFFNEGDDFSKLVSFPDEYLKH